MRRFRSFNHSARKAVLKVSSRFAETGFGESGFGESSFGESGLNRSESAGGDLFET